MLAALRSVSERQMRLEIESTLHVQLHRPSSSTVLRMAKGELDLLEPSVTGDTSVTKCRRLVAYVCSQSKPTFEA